MDLETIVQEVPKSYIPIFIEMMELDSMKDIMAFRAAQSEANRRKIDILMKLVQLEAINEKVNQMESYPDAENLLKKFTKTG